MASASSIGVILWPFLWAGRWYTKRGWILKAVVGVALLVLIGLYANFFYATQWWNNFNPNYVDNYTFEKRNVSAGEQVAGGRRYRHGQDLRQARPSPQVAADLTDFNVNQNAWISSMILYKLGLFGMDWDHTPFMDNKASFQRGINQAVRRTATELADNLGRVRTTSQIDADLQDARGNLQFDEYTWYFGLNPFGPKTPTPSYYRDAVRKLRSFNARLGDLPGDVRRPRRQSEAIYRPHRQRHRLDLGDPQGARREPQCSAGSTPAPTTASGSPTASSTPITG